MNKSDEIPRESILVENAATEVLCSVTNRLRKQSLPSATYRIQFNKEFTFRDAVDVVPYLNSLGITFVYASPYLKSRSGSTHGYDVVDPTALNPELGSESSYLRFVNELRDFGMGHILDFVPNHMGVGGEDNPWWQDVLENGPSSPYATYFDIDWHPLKPDLDNKVLLPVLGEQFGSALENGLLKLGIDAGTFYLKYFERQFPISPHSFAIVLRHRLDNLERRLNSEHPHFQEYQSILTAIKNLPPREETDVNRLHERHREKEIIKRRLQRLCEESSAINKFVDENVVIFNGRSGQPDSFNFLDELLQNQAYRMAYWRVAADEINYRRFFDVNELAALCMENPLVFESTHRRVLQLLDEELLDGLRIDHADGLYAPKDYLWELQERRFLQLCRHEFVKYCQLHRAKSELPEWENVAAILRHRFQNSSNDVCPTGQPLYLIVEKILEGHEPLPDDWPVHGTSGYDFLNQVNNLFVSSHGEKLVEKVYSRFIGEAKDFDELVYQSKRLIMKVSMAGEVNMLGHQLDRISEQNRRSRDFTLNGLTHVLREIVACFPVYRTYTTKAGVLDRDRQYIERAVAEGKRRNPAINHAVFDFVRDLLLLELPGARAPSSANEEGRSKDSSGNGWYNRDSILEFIGRFQQYTGPMMAKAVEDTAYYNYHRLISLNEVGGNPRQFGCSVNEFHSFNLQRQSSYPGSLSATATHDTKRGEDTRIRINALSQVPQTWNEHVRRWARWNRSHKKSVEGVPAPSRNDEYLLYQTLIGTWPFESPYGLALSSYVERIQNYMIKALREAKVHSSWIAPNEPYERATLEFVATILADEPLTPFRADFEPFARKIADCGVWESLSQTLLKLTVPGVPDIYQGTELWDLSLVDPDNRRAVNYTLRRRFLNELHCHSADAATRKKLAEELVANATDGRIKLFVTSKGLHLRRENPELFSTGEYIPLEVRGERSEHLCAFARRNKEQLVLVVAPRLTALLCAEPGRPPQGRDAWHETSLVLPSTQNTYSLRNLFTGQSYEVHPGDETMDVKMVLQLFPVGLLSST